MGFPDLLKGNKKAKTATPDKIPSKEHICFAETVLEIIGPAVEEFGFNTHRIEIEKYFTTIIFRKGSQYLKISGSTYPTDYPSSYNVILGDGDREKLSEWDWNSIALWKLKEKIVFVSGAKEYEFPFDGMVKLSVFNALKELVDYAGGFLAGDLSMFYETRSEVNNNRVPYKIHNPDINDNFSTTIQQKSAEQKGKYS